MSTEKRIRLVLVVDEEVRATLRLESGKTEKDMSDIVADLVREHCGESLREVRRRRKKAEDAGE
jgi:hypothetical protein